ncbi:MULTISPECIES: universal stress protein [unclassified Devosia]|uniref:universal stress protein n=1 Tax=unclassified Devosia TaxID=196773 RepID=UPI0015FD52D6|nr:MULTISPECIES: universal stress protein [unclassified Devosia]MBJ6988624.1 universal stress protein [Devosia sp. MC521]MBJ7579492.1 universal stress protein [Devosia sp. MC532]MBK1794955.1 universal stress protein [Devosia sp. WQ 349K1]QMW62575.1 universal stress protein [Devosia sp. MC521]
MFKSILIATDGSELANKALSAALELAKLNGASVIALTSTDPIVSALGGGSFGAIDAGSILSELEESYAKHAKTILAQARDIAQAQGVNIETRYLAEHRPADAILEAAEKIGCDTIVMGSHGRRGFQRMLLGSQAAEVLARSTIPVLVIK